MLKAKRNEPGAGLRATKPLRLGRGLAGVEGWREMKRKRERAEIEIITCSAQTQHRWGKKQVSDELVAEKRAEESQQQRTDITGL